MRQPLQDAAVIGAGALLALDMAEAEVATLRAGRESLADRLRFGAFCDKRGRLATSVISTLTQAAGGTSTAGRAQSARFVGRECRRAERRTQQHHRAQRPPNRVARFHADTPYTRRQQD